eukprot:gnl/TRDRNA2_/TRDRNA2_132863_c2_seq1.p1 gnl/TRDRNA2_/TRDRNA2_132863_c2~~gnl/TRDRNA2_/TRDRNA2_132863_c2_seq1.p1  ORF type:complete len:185 (-),score=55.62 gnl/TRDRNA2_/TRDRNA2_132863_c2_seq1:47-601(-)
MSKFEGKADFKVNWLPFQLNPSAAGGQGVNKMEMYKKKFGEERVAAMLPRMLQTGKEHGINFSYGGNVGNTYDSHRLISFAAKQGKQDELVEELFHNYFEQEKCLSDRAVLLAAAQKAGLSGAEEMLNSKAECADVDRDLQTYQNGMRIGGVPYFIVDGGKFQESGALDSSAFCQMFQQVLAGK